MTRTDELQNGIKINAATLEIDEDNGALIYHKDVTMALRRHLGMSDPHPNIC